MATFTFPAVSIDTTGLATEAKQDAIITELTTANTTLTSLDGKDFATETTLASLEGKDFATQTTLAAVLVDTGVIAGDTTSIDSKTPALGAAIITGSTPVNIASDQVVPVSATALPLPTGAATEATLASLEGKDFATQTTLAAVLTELGLKADLTETQPVSAAALPLPAGAATEATLASLEGKDFATQTTLAAVLTELGLKADLTETQPVSLASQPLPTGAATESTLAAQALDIGALEDRLAGALIPEAFDYIALTYVAAGDGAGEIETVTYKTGGSGGSTVGTLTLGYDASDRLDEITKT